MNENENNAVCISDEEKSSAETVAETAVSIAPIPIIEGYGEIPTKNESSTISERRRKHGAVRALRFVLLKVVPCALAIFSFSVPLVLASFFVKDLDITAAGIVQLMLGDFAGGAENVTVIETPKSNPSTVLPLESDSTSSALEQNAVEQLETQIIIPSLSNETPYTPDMEEILQMPRAIPSAHDIYAEFGEGAPIVLIIHTHATEGFSNTADTGYRTDDTARNVVSIGELIADKLEAEGIATLHCKDLFDSPDFNMAYYNASLKIREYINAYPSISYVLDIHRDSIQLEDGTYYSPSVSTDKGTAAQLMFVIGTDHGGSGHTSWANNLSLAARLHASIEADNPTMMRSINLRSASFNEQYTKGSLLIEVGACASDYEEAVLTAEILAEHLAREILG